MASVPCGAAQDAAQRLGESARIPEIIERAMMKEIAGREVWRRVAARARFTVRRAPRRTQVPWWPDGSHASMVSVRDGESCVPR